MKAREVAVLATTADGLVAVDRVFRVSTQRGRADLCAEVVTLAELAAMGGYFRIELGEVRK